MKKNLFTIMLLLAAVLSSRAADGPDIIASILFLTGESDIESVPENEIEHYFSLAENPLRINCLTRSKLMSSGLFSMYQVASLIDYRTRNGDILSISELADVDGFGMETVEALSPFISLESYSLPGQSSERKADVRNSLILNGISKLSFPFDGSRLRYSWAYSGKYRMFSDSHFDGGVSFKRYNVDRSVTPTSYTIYAAYYGQRHLETFVAGDLSLRFGQGLALWTGFSVGGISGERSFWKRPSGVSPSGSYSASSSMRGVATALSFGRFGISMFAVMPGLRAWCESGTPFSNVCMPGINVSWYSKYGQIGLTSYCNTDHSEGKTSVDARFCIGGNELFGEAAIDMLSLKVAGIVGMSARISDKLKTAWTCRYIPVNYSSWNISPVRMFSGKKGECGFSAGLFFKQLTLTADMAFREVWEERQMKMIVSYPWTLLPSVILSMRLQESLRSYGNRNRTDFRADLRWNSSSWQTIVRTNILATDVLSWLAYVEEGYSGRIGAVFLRGTLFRADSWDNRIYCYERDAPGNFNVPAYYGRGYSVSIAARMRLQGHGMKTWKMYLRAAFTDTPWQSPGQKTPKPAKAELKVQVMYCF